MSNHVKISDYDELEILVDEKSVRNGDASLCRNAFHFQYGNDEGKDFAGLKVKNKENSVYSDRRSYVGGDFNEGYAEVGSDGIGNGLAGLLGGGGIATKARGSIKTPSERDIDISRGGSRSAADIMKVVRQRTPGLRHIYNKFLKHRPGFAGKVTLKFTIAPDGEITKISVASSTTGYKDFDDEIKLAVSRWKFKRVEDGYTTLSIPFSFSE